MSIHGTEISLLDHSIGSDLVVESPDANDVAVFLFSESTLRDSLVKALGDGSTAVQARVNGAATSAIQNVTAVATGASSVGIGVLGQSAVTGLACTSFDARAIAENTIARGTQADVSATSVEEPGCSPAVSSLTISYSNFRTSQESGSGNVAEGAGNQTSTAPTDDAAIFADTTNYRQREGAPTYNAGVNGDDSGFVDPDGDPRRGDGRVDIGADELPTTPVVSTAPATAVAATSAEVNGSVDPQSKDVFYRFEFGPTPALGFNTAEVSLDGSKPATSIQETLSGLAPSSTVFYRAYARSTGVQPRTSVGETMSFTTLSNLAPAVVTNPATKVNATSALLHGSVKPNGYATTWRFDLGKTLAYGTTTPMQSAGAGQAAIPVAFTMDGVKPHTTYHYRLLATSQIATALGSDETFTTKRLKVRGVKVKPKRFRMGSDLPHVAKVGTVINFRLNGDAKVKLKFLRITAGRLVPKGAFRYKAEAGKQRIRFEGRLSRKKKLEPGKYKLVVRAKTKGVRSKKAKAKFRLLPRR